MKTRLFGYALIIVVLGALAFLTTSQNSGQPMQNQPVQQEDSNLKGLKIN